mmetsp:Transcript_7450/g.12621  ORF Transcript_7450/g.12621 Transcript_7450/m.12621 type:complete len:414 (-) Transcript_7450:80-1321(-)|eukprot:CAMPEP_0119313494 /NCGR_PEP_ID=MMETSP1333-20130426/29310_1 /TAXON_ID=418940 /ORGANISM="Scyphosphaera apsteinii, Strain RCC1455" /LENGTH=413 /DNA_ID=CAMNT_0007318343 /DNA_START=173 /DNA_END=1414 /DNA_ORIENTATION=+
MPYSNVHYAHISKKIASAAQVEGSMANRILKANQQRRTEEAADRRAKEAEIRAAAEEAMQRKQAEQAAVEAELAAAVMQRKHAERVLAEARYEQERARQAAREEVCAMMQESLEATPPAENSAWDSHINFQISCEKTEETHIEAATRFLQIRQQEFQRAKVALERLQSRVADTNRQLALRDEARRAGVQPRPLRAQAVIRHTTHSQPRREQAGSTKGARPGMAAAPAAAMGVAAQAGKGASGRLGVVMPTSSDEAPSPNVDDKADTTTDTGGSAAPRCGKVRHGSRTARGAASFAVATVTVDMDAAAMPRPAVGAVNPTALSLLKPDAGRETAGAIPCASQPSNASGIVNRALFQWDALQLRKPEGVLPAAASRSECARAAWEWARQRDDAMSCSPNGSSSVDSAPGQEPMKR